MSEVPLYLYTTSQTVPRSLCKQGAVSGSGGIESILKMTITSMRRKREAAGGMDGPQGTAAAQSDLTRYILHLHAQAVTQARPLLLGASARPLSPGHSTERARPCFRATGFSPETDGPTRSTPRPPVPVAGSARSSSGRGRKARVLRCRRILCCSKLSSRP